MAEAVQRAQRGKRIPAGGRVSRDRTPSTRWLGNGLVCRDYAVGASSDLVGWGARERPTAEPVGSVGGLLPRLRIERACVAPLANERERDRADTPRQPQRANVDTHPRGSSIARLFARSLVWGRHVSPRPNSDLYRASGRIFPRRWAGRDIRGGSLVGPIEGILQATYFASALLGFWGRLHTWTSSRCGSSSNSEARRTLEGG